MFWLQTLLFLWGDAVLPSQGLVPRDHQHPAGVGGWGLLLVATSTSASVFPDSRCLGWAPAVSGDACLLQAAPGLPLSQTSDHWKGLAVYIV